MVLFRRARARRILKAAAIWKAMREDPKNYFGGVLWVKIKNSQGHVMWVPENGAAGG